VTADIERHIVALDRAWEDAIINEDADELERLGADDLIYTHAGGWIEGKAGFLGHITDGPLRFPVIEYADTEVRLHGECAVLTCELHLQTLDREGAVGDLHFRVTHVWSKIGPDWRLLASQSTHMPIVDGAP
jgi:ketosteroid isomerase-like protein